MEKPSVTTGDTALSEKFRDKLAARLKTKPGTFLVILLLCLLGLVLRLDHLNEKSLWSDEICTIATALGNSVDIHAVQNFDPSAPVPASVYQAKALTSHGLFAFDETVRVLRQNIHPPLFFWLMNVWIHLFGSQPFALRLLAVLFGVACIPMMFLAGRRLAGTPVGLTAAALMSFSGYQIAHAQDARAYTLMTLLALSSAWVLLRLLDQDKADPKGHHITWEWRIFLVLTTMGLYTQYFFGIFYLFLLCYGAFRKWHDRKFLWRLGISATLTAVFFLPWLLVFKDQIGFMQQEGHYTHGLWKFIQLPEIMFRTLTDFVSPQAIWIKGLTLALLLTALAVWFKTGRNGPEENKKPLAQLSQGPIGFILFWLLFILGGQILLDVAKDSHTLSIRRYTLLAAPAFYLLLAFCMVQLRSHLGGYKRVGVTILSVVFLGFIVQNAFQVLSGKKLRSDDFRQAAQWVNARTTPEDLVLVHKSGAIAVGMAYYMSPSTRMLGIPAEASAELLANQPLTKRIRQSALSANRVFLVLSHSGGKISSAIEKNLITTGFREVSFKKFPGVRVMMYRSGEKTPQKTNSRLKNRNAHPRE